MTDEPTVSLTEDDFRRELLAVLPHLRAFARGLCGRPDLADDLVQETAIRAWSARLRFRPGTSIRAWTFTIMRNHFLNDRRRAGREVGYDPDIPEHVVATDGAQEASLHVSDMQRALMLLPEERREALLLVGAGGFSYDEAAEICGVAPGTMKSRVARGRAALFRYFGEGAKPETAPPASVPADRARARRAPA